MNYHLNQPGQVPGVVPLEELRRRRQAGELAGTEFVWREGMTDWQSLDEVLRANPSSPPPLPPPLPAPNPAQAQPKRKIGFPVAIIALGLITIVGGLAAFGFLAAQRQQRLQAAYQARRSRQEITAKSPWAGRPMVGATNGLSARELQGSAREFRVRQWVEGYEARGDRGTSCDTPSLRMLNQWIVQNYGGSTNAKAVSVTSMCDRLAANPECLDPLVLTVAGVESSEESAKIERLERALATFPQSKHRGYPKLYAAVSLAATEEHGSPKMRTLDAASLEFLGESFSDGSFLPEDQSVLGEIFLTGWGYNFFYRKAPAVTQLAQSAGEPFRWLALMLEGEHHVMLAWRARGGDYANKVTEDGWKGFQTNLVTARQCFSNAWQMHPDWPLSAARMVDVAMGDADAPEMLRWFNRAIAVQVDQPQAWNSLRWGLRPRWHGSLEAMLALGQAAVDTGRFDTDVPRKYFDVVSDLEAELEVGHGHHLYGRPDIWPHLQRMYEGYVAEPTEAANVAGWRSTYAMIAYLAGKYDVARPQLENVQWQPRKGVSEGWGTDGSVFLLEVAARTGPAGATIAAAESNRLRGNLPEAVRLLKELPGGTNVDERTRSFVNYRLAALEGEMRLRGGGWTDFLPGEDIERGWRVAAGQPRRLSDGALEVEPGRAGHLLWSRARVGADFEVKGEFEVTYSPTKEFEAGIVVGVPEMGTADWLAFRMKRDATDGDTVAFSRAWTTRQTTQRVHWKDGRNTFQFRLQGGKATASVNGTEVLRDALPGRTAQAIGDEVYVGLGGYNDRKDTVICYRNVQVRRLAEPPPTVPPE